MTHLLFLTGMIALLVTGCGFTSTSPGEAVVFSRFGAVDPTCYPAGFYLYNPLTTSVYHVDVKVQKFRSSPESVPGPAFMRLAVTGAARPWPSGL